MKNSVDLSSMDKALAEQSRERVVVEKPKEKPKSVKKKTVKELNPVVSFDPFNIMVGQFEEFAKEHQLVKPLKLVFEEQKPGVVFIYQGQKNVIWAWLRNTGCLFVRKSILRTILNLTDKHPLKKYFKNYSLISGEFKNE